RKTGRSNRQRTCSQLFNKFIAKLTAIIYGYDTRRDAHSIEDALMCYADRIGIDLGSGWFSRSPDYCTVRIDHEIIRPAKIAKPITSESTTDRHSNVGAIVIPRSITQHNLCDRITMSPRYLATR